MRKLIYSIGVIVSGLLLLFTACTEDENKNLEINFVNNIDEVNVSSGSSYTIVATIISEAGLDYVKIFEVTDKSEIQVKLIDKFDDKNNFTLMYTVENITKDVKIKIEATDKDNQTVAKYFEIKLNTNQTQNLKTYTVSLGAQSNVTGSFLIASQGSVFTIKEVKNNSAYSSIDIIYYYGATNKCALFCPKSIVDNNITWDGNLPTSNWGTTPNVTIFKKVTSNDFDNATYSNVSSLITENDNNKIASDLKVGDVVAFKTQNGKYGILKVTSISSADASGKITFTYKIQE